MYATEAIVMGAGVVGLACARKLTQMGIETIVLESESNFGQGISSRNSEVIHAGIYYPENSLKASLCLKGRDLLYDYCKKYNVPHQKIGKLIVATSSDQSNELEKIFHQAKRNGCEEVEMASSKMIKKESNQLKCYAAIHSPMTGIVDSHSLMMSMLGNIEECGGNLILKSKILDGEILDNGIKITIDDYEKTTIKAKYVVNSLGLEAVPFLKKLNGFPSSEIPNYAYAKGSYFSLLGKNPFKKLIYPIPEKAGLGIHLTIDLQGNARFGPDVEWISEVDFNVPYKSNEKFLKAIKQYWPSISLDRLSPSYAGIRPKLGNKENPYNDFLIQDFENHKIKGLVNLLGIESPGLTSSIAIADMVAYRLLEV